MQTDVYSPREVALAAGVSEEQMKQRTSRQPIPRGGTPAEVAEAYLHLMRAGFTTGQVLRVDGGSGLT